jgi:RHS repeat-associated protein
LTVTGGATFVYDGDGNRVKKTEGGQTILYINQYYEKNITTGVVTTSYYLGGQLVATREGTTLRYVHQDNLNSTSTMTDTNGAQIGTTLKYVPFGDLRSGSVPTDKKFTGQRLDSTGLYYYNARYYDPAIGRFISPDSTGQKLNDPQTLNRYSYCENNPLRYTDPTGHWNWEKFWAGVAIVGLVAAVGLTVAVCLIQPEMAPAGALAVEQEIAAATTAAEIFETVEAVAEVNVLASAYVIVPVVGVAFGTTIAVQGACEPDPSKIQQSSVPVENNNNTSESNAQNNNSISYNSPENAQNDNAGCCYPPVDSSGATYDVTGPVPVFPWWLYDTGGL